MMGPFLLLLTTFIWGTAFLAQKYGAANLGPFSMTVFRNILGGGFLLVCVLIRYFKNRGKSDVEKKGSIRYSIIAGICCGVPLCMAMTTQQIGIEFTSPGISAFLTTNYVLFVPVIVAILTRKMPSLKICIGVVMALVGTYFICMTGANSGGGFSGVGKGELWTILCAVFFSIQMVTVDHFAAKVDLLVMSAVQLLTCSVVASPFLLMEAEASKIAAGGILNAWIPLVYCGIFSSGIAYTLQNVAQARTPAAMAAILMSMESVFGTISGFVCLGDRMSVGQTMGCLIVLAAVIWTQLPAKSHKS
jgi:drug/metabolite transporter (DMT)-like permease